MEEDGESSEENDDEDTGDSEESGDSDADSDDEEEERKQEEKQSKKSKHAAGSPEDMSRKVCEPMIYMYSKYENIGILLPLPSSYCYH